MTATFDDQLTAARAKARRVLPPAREVIRGQEYEFSSVSEWGRLYAVKRRATGWTCDCRDFDLTGCCVHLGALVDRAEVEGWDFEGSLPLPEPTWPAETPASIRREEEAIDLWAEQEAQVIRGDIDPWDNERFRWRFDPTYGPPT